MEKFAAFFFIEVSVAEHWRVCIEIPNAGSTLLNSTKEVDSKLAAAEKKTVLSPFSYRVTYNWKAFMTFSILLQL